MKLGSLIFTVFLFAALRLASAQEGISTNVAPPDLPTLEQPPCPADGYIWTPGYWAYDAGGYYWVPGVWLPPPQIGLLWTPPWWGFNNGAYVFHEGYWGPSVGYYGGINYGHGYFGHDYWGGRWEGNVFRYNTAVTRVDTNVVQKTFVDESVLKNEPKTSGAGFNGPGGVKAEPNAEEKEAEEHRKTPPTSEQVAQQEAASKDRNLHASVNNGRPNAEAIRSFNERKENPEPAQENNTAAGAGNKPQNKPAADSQGPEQNSDAERANAGGQGASGHGSDRTTKSSGHPEKSGGNRGGSTRQQHKEKSAKPKSPSRGR
jgi:hypothetical protein